MGTTGTEIAPAIQIAWATAIASHQFGSCQTTTAPGPMSWAARTLATRAAASASSAQETSWVSSITAVARPNSKTLRCSKCGTTTSVWNPDAR